MQPLDKAVALRPAYFGGPVFNSLQLQEQLIGMMVRAPAELAPVVRQDGINLCLMGFEERQHRFIEHMNRGHRQLAGVEPSLGEQSSTVCSTPCQLLELADENGVDRHQFLGVEDFCLAFVKLGAEVIGQAHLLVIEFNHLFSMGFIEVEQAVEFGGQAVTLRHATDTVCPEAEVSAGTARSEYFYRQSLGHKGGSYFYCIKMDRIGCF